MKTLEPSAVTSAAAAFFLARVHVTAIATEYALNSPKIHRPSHRCTDRLSMTSGEGKMERYLLLASIQERQWCTYRRPQERSEWCGLCAHADGYRNMMELFHEDVLYCRWRRVPELEWFEQHGVTAGWMRRVRRAKHAVTEL